MPPISPICISTSQEERLRYIAKRCERLMPDRVLPTYSSSSFAEHIATATEKKRVLNRWKLCDGVIVSAGCQTEVSAGRRLFRHASRHRRSRNIRAERRSNPSGTPSRITSARGLVRSRRLSRTPLCAGLLHHGDQNRG